MKSKIKRNQFSDSLDEFEEYFQITAGLERAELYMPTHVFGTKKLLGRGHRNILFVIKDGKNIGYFSKKDVKELGTYGLKRFENRTFFKRISHQAQQQEKNTVHLALYFDSIDLSQLSNELLIEYFSQLYSSIQSTFSYFNLSQPAISFAIEKAIMDQCSKDHLKDILREQIAAYALSQDAPTQLEIEERELISIINQIKKNPDLVSKFVRLNGDDVIKELIEYHNDIFSLLQTHQKRYGYFSSYENYDLNSIVYYIKRIQRYLCNVNLLRKKRKELRKNYSQIRLDRKKFYHKNRFSIRLRYLIDLSRILAYQRMELRLSHTFGISILRKFYEEFSQRMDIPFNEITFLLKQEIFNYFENNILPNQKEIQKRKRATVYWLKNGRLHVFTGKDAESLINCFFKKDYGDTLIHGMVANPGKVIGKVKRIDYGSNIASQIDYMDEGDILVSGNTRPEVILACQKASAIITDEGGILSHAALVSRELKIPCIVGTKIATKVLKDGDIVEVDADEGIVRKIQ